MAAASKKIDVVSITPEERKELGYRNETFPGGKVARDKRLAELRQKYAQHPMALWDLDVHDLESEFHKQQAALRETFEHPNEAKRKEIITWMDKYFAEKKR
ncbi:MAG TPA: hypothetical protein VFG51_02895 [Candidatus Saccharimonadia bacterium]|nr:hypothetical protein [Candidatus Saccharimonadia bacterium]